ncbi:MAG TPA: DUF2147 domain-containing protein [Pseudomonadales bacterium]
MTFFSSQIARGARAVGTLVVQLMLAAQVVAAEPVADEDADLPMEVVYGIWASSGTMIEVGPARDGGLSARIISLKHPTWREKDRAGVAGEPKTDLRNPDPARQQTPLIGLELLRDYRFDRGRWHGRLYLPTSGNTWNSTARVKDGKLYIRGFLGISLLGHTQTFEPIERCSENIVRMIENAGLTGTPCDVSQADAEGH